MKKTMMIILISTICFVLFYAFNTKRTNYTMTGTVYSVGSEVTTIEDETGNLWEIDNEDFEKDEEVVITFNNQNTHDRFDDEVKKVKKI